MVKTSKKRRHLKLKRAKRITKRRIRRMGGSNCEDEKCMYSADGKHKFGLVAWREYRCQNKNEKGEQCPCGFHD